MVNKFIRELKPSATLAINQKIQSLRDQGIEVYHFGFGQSPFPIHNSIIEALKKNADNNHYLPTVGLEELRKSISKFLLKYQEIKTDSKFIYIGPGSKELLYQTILILEGVFLIPKGSWVSYGPQIKTKGDDYVILDTYLEDSFKLTPKVLESYCIAHPNEQKTLIFNSPNNPTGAVYSKEELIALATICRSYNVIVLSDEIYSQINFISDSTPSISNFYPERTIVFGGLSKVFSAGGYRLGFMALPEDLQFLHNTYRSLFSETFSAVASPIQHAAINAYNPSDSLLEYISNTSEILNAVSSYIYESLSKVGIECTKAEGAFYMMIGFNNFKDKFSRLGILTSAQLADYFLKTVNVALLPGSDFYFKENDLFFRLAFVDFDGDKVMKAYEKDKKIDVEFIKKYCPHIYKGVAQLIKFTQEIS